MDLFILYQFHKSLQSIYRKDYYLKIYHISQITTVLNNNNELTKTKKIENNNYANQNYYNYYGYGYNYASKNNTDNNTKNKTKGFKRYPGAIFLFWFFIIFAIGLYLICLMKEF